MPLETPSKPPFAPLFALGIVAHDWPLCPCVVLEPRAGALASHPRAADSLLRWTKDCALHAQPVFSDGYWLPRTALFPPGGDDPTAPRVLRIA